MLFSISDDDSNENDDHDDEDDDNYRSSTDIRAVKSQHSSRVF
jgi:hypothetical protein